MDRVGSRISDQKHPPWFPRNTEYIYIYRERKNDDFLNFQSKGGIIEVMEKRRLIDFFQLSSTINLLITTVLAISCNDIMREGSVNDFTKDELFTLSSNTPQQLETCLFILGKDEIDSMKAQVIWTVIKQIYGSVSDIPEESLKQLGWIIAGIPADDFYNITIPDVDMVSSFGLYRNLSIYQLTALKLSAENQWGRKTADQLTSYDLAALKQILCAFNESEIASIHPDSYRDAASELSTLQKCPRSALNQLVALATDETAFGKPSNWNAIQVTSIGCVMNGLSSAHGIPPESMEGITPQIVKCLSPSFLQTMSERQFQHFTTNAASSLSSSQRDALSSDQRYALEQAVTGLRYAKRNSAHLCCGFSIEYIFKVVILQTSFYHMKAQNFY